MTITTSAGASASQPGACGAEIYIQPICVRATYKLTWEEIVALYRLTLGPAPHNFQPRHNVCPTTTIDTIVEHDGERGLERRSLLASASTQIHRSAASGPRGGRSALGPPSPTIRKTATSD